MEFATVIKFFGTQCKAAAALGVNQSSIAAWKRNGIPVPRQYQIEVVSGGALKVNPTPTPSPDSGPPQ